VTTRFHFALQAQPDETTCGPTCLHGIYEYWGDVVPLSTVIRDVQALEEGGTLAVWLAIHALRRGYRTTIYPYNLYWLDPTWFDLPMDLIAEKLRRQAERADTRKRKLTCEAYAEYLEAGGVLRFADLSTDLLCAPIDRGVPVLTGLSATWLYRAARENPLTFEDDDVAGVPSGHFVVLCGHDRSTDELVVADPYRENPIRRESHYEVPVQRVMTSILLGIASYDANLLLIEPESRTDA
jgi:hypothetical protein